MKSSNKKSIFAFVLGMMIVTIAQVAVAGSEVNIEKSVKSGISKESEIEFSSYIAQTVPTFIAEGNWSIIEKVVTLYNQAPSDVRKLSQQEIHVFNAAVADLGSKLENVNDEAANRWKAELYKTASSVRFVKNFDLNSLDSNVLEGDIEAPKTFGNF